ncbi:TPA: Hok/Gef family protein [Escherichia coli]
MLIICITILTFTLLTRQTLYELRFRDAPRDKCTLSCAINGIHAAFHYLKKNYISGCVMTVPTG